MLVLRRLPALALLSLSIWACTPGRSYQPNAKLSFEIGGICSECPTTRLDTLIRKLEGVVQVRLDSNTLALDYDSTALTRQFIISILNESGYDADDNLALLPTLVDSCCRRGIIKRNAERDAKKDKSAYEEDDDLGSADDLSLSDFDLDAGDDRNLDAMLNDELEGVLEDDLLNEVETNQTEELLNNDAEDDLDDIEKANDEKEKKDNKAKDNGE